MRKTDSVPDQRIPSTFDRQVKRLKMDMEIPAGGRFNGSPYIIPRIPDAYPCLIGRRSRLPAPGRLQLNVGRARD